MVLDTHLLARGCLELPQQQTEERKLSWEQCFTHEASGHPAYVSRELRGSRARAVSKGPPREVCLPGKQTPAGVPAEVGMEVELKSAIALLITTAEKGPQPSCCKEILKHPMRKHSLCQRAFNREGGLQVTIYLKLPFSPLTHSHVKCNGQKQRF